MSEPQTPVKSCVVGIPFLISKLDDRGGNSVEVVATQFLYTNVAELLQRCNAAGVVLLQDPKTLTDP